LERSGIGLAMVLNYAKTSGGKQLISDRLRGASFVLTWPKHPTKITAAEDLTG
jgi:signal transduction histidine kinase